MEVRGLASREDGSEETESILGRGRGASGGRAPSGRCNLCHGCALATTFVTVCLVCMSLLIIRLGLPAQETAFDEIMRKEGGELVTRKRFWAVFTRMAHTVVLPHPLMKRFVPPASPYVLHLVDDPYHSSCRSMYNMPLNASEEGIGRWGHHAPLLLDDPNLVHLFASDWRGEPHPKVTVMPIGFQSGASHNGKEAMLIEIARTLPPVRSRPLQVLCTAHLRTYAQPKSGSRLHRQEMHAALKGKPFITFVDKPMGRRTLYRSYANFSFELCPEGNGMDTHRFYEAQLLHTIPIIVKNPLSEELYSRFFPVVVLDKWEDLTYDRLAAWRDQYAKQFVDEPLRVRFWAERAARVLRASGLRTGY